VKTMQEIIQEIKDTPFPLMTAIKEIINERARQVIKWGKQSWPDGTGKPTAQTFAESAKSLNDYERTTGETNWARILEEEFWEALTETDPKKLREELVQVAAVAVAWVEDIDTRGDK